MIRTALPKKAVMAGFFPAIHVLPSRCPKDVDARNKSGGMTAEKAPSLRWVSLLRCPASFSDIASASAGDLKLCNRMSYVIEAAIGIDEKSATATRGWFRIDPAACRVVLQGTLTADRILLNARALPVYGASPLPQEWQRHPVRGDR